MINIGIDMEVKRKKSYLEIGCKAKYLIRTDNLSDKKEAKCTKLYRFN